jgi:SAM-dependent methyltransferase
MTAECSDDVRGYWNARAGLGQWAGTRDVLAKQLEMEAIASHVRDGMRALDLGCGNGITALELARRYRVEVTGIDYAEEMVAAATRLAAGQALKGAVSFRVGDVLRLPPLPGGYDVVFTERTFINLPDWPAQRQAVGNALALVRPGGLFLMCENSQDGLERMNEFRAAVGLPKVTPPWHNRYLRDAELATLSFPDARLEEVIHHSSTYYFLSRVVNAWLAAQEGKEPDYEAAVNRLALRLPPLGEFGQGRIWKWRKAP